VNQRLACSCFARLGECHLLTLVEVTGIRWSLLKFLLLFELFNNFVDFAGVGFFRLCLLRLLVCELLNNFIVVFSSTLALIFLVDLPENGITPSLLGCLIDHTKQNRIIKRTKKFVLGSVRSLTAAWSTRRFFPVQRKLLANWLSQ